MNLNLEPLSKATEIIGQIAQTLQTELTNIRNTADLRSQLDIWLQNGLKIQEDLGRLSTSLAENIRHLAANSTSIPEQVSQLVQQSGQLNSAMAAISRLQDEMLSHTENLDQAIATLSKSVETIQTEGEELLNQINILNGNKESKPLEPSGQESDKPGPSTTNSSTVDN
jgi:uncharacterized coiled-coil DUF342 family protein